eukprot:jgi/Psemu1/10043/gm1.10043_g
MTGNVLLPKKTYNVPNFQSHDCLTHLVAMLPTRDVVEAPIKEKNPFSPFLEKRQPILVCFLYLNKYRVWFANITKAATTVTGSINK